MRGKAILMAMTTLGLLGAHGASVSASPTGTSSVSHPAYPLSPTGVTLPEKGALFGTFVRPDDHTGNTRREAMTNFEALVGRQMATERVYDLWDDPFPTDDDLWSRDLGRTLYVSWNASPRDGTGCKGWANIAAGLYDAEIDAKAEALKSFGAPIIFSFHHEPTTKPEFGGDCGTGEDYKAAWRYIHDRFQTDGVTNATYAWTMTAQSFQNGKGDEYYPGNGIIDLIAADGYNWYSCEFHNGPWREMDEIFQSFYDYGVSKGKPMFIAEYGSGEDDAVVGRKAQWFANGADLLKRWSEIKGVSYFNVGTGGACDRYADSSPTSLQAFSAMGHDTYFNPPPTVSNVAVADFAFTPKGVDVGQGSGVEWTSSGPSDHTVTNTDAIALFDSGTLTPGSSFLSWFPGAGIYVYHCEIHTTMKGRITVPMALTPSSGNLTTPFAITWSAEWAPAEFVYDVQIKRPTETTWSNWQNDTAANSATFVPDDGTGRYWFRARLVRLSDGTAARWSKGSFISVS
jgi:plastocyanin